MTHQNGRRKPVRGTGQHFLHDHRVIRKMIQIVNINRNHLVLDIGAGKGAITHPLSQLVKRVISIENDPGLVAHLERTFSGKEQVKVIQKDARSINLPGKPFMVVSNIPFAITTDLLGKLMDRPSNSFVGGVLLIEWGAAKRFTEPWSLNPRIIGWNTWFNIELAGKVKPASFTPQPRVDSALLKISRRKHPPVKPDKYWQFQAFVATLLLQPYQESSRSLRSLFTYNQVNRIMADAAIAANTPVCRLDVSQWAHCFSTMEQLLPKRAHPTMPGKFRKIYRKQKNG